MKTFFYKIIQGVKNAILPEVTIENYKKVKLKDNWSSAEKLNYTIKNYAKDFLTINPEFGYKLWELAKLKDEKPLITIMGEFKTGKSTFINAILGQEVLKSDVTPATAVVTMITYGKEEKLIAYFKDGNRREYPLNMLGSLTAEGDDSKQKLRNKVKYVELQMPHKLLSKITLVDTPGLNVDNQSHIEATKYFMDKADLVLWIFAYGKVASRTELAAINELGEHLKPIAIVNRIDEIDEEEETLEEVLEEIRSKLKTSVRDVFGISSIFALKGIQENKQNLLDESGWAAFYEAFEQKFINIAIREKKIVSYISNLLWLINSEFFHSEQDLVLTRKNFKENISKLKEKQTGFGLTQFLLSDVQSILSKDKSLNLVKNEYAPKVANFLDRINVYRETLEIRELKEELKLIQQEKAKAKKVKQETLIRKQRLEASGNRILAIILAIAFVPFLLFKPVLLSSYYVDKAMTLLDEQKYEEALSTIERLEIIESTDPYSIRLLMSSAYKERESLINYAKGLRYYEEKDYDMALHFFYKAGDFKDSLVLFQEVQESCYQTANAHLANENYYSAMELFKDLRGYKDSPARLEIAQEGLYQQAIEHYQNKEYSDAKTLFYFLGNYKDSDYYEQYIRENY